MTRPYHFARPIGIAVCQIEGSETVSIPVFPGLLKHPHPSELVSLISDRDVARKYTRLALEKASWQILKEFPRPWLSSCLPEIKVRPGRLKALRFLMGLDKSPHIKEVS
jgi:hypothetical protein